MHLYVLPLFPLSGYCLLPGAISLSCLKVIKAPNFRFEWACKGHPIYSISWILCKEHPSIPRAWWLKRDSWSLTSPAASLSPPFCTLGKSPVAPLVGPLEHCASPPPPCSPATVLPSLFFRLKLLISHGHLSEGSRG